MVEVKTNRHQTWVEERLFSLTESFPRCLPAPAEKVLTAEEKLINAAKDAMSMYRHWKFRDEYYNCIFGPLERIVNEHENRTD